jgi:hypothetical protein
MLGLLLACADDPPAPSDRTGVEPTGETGHTGTPTSSPTAPFSVTAGPVVAAPADPYVALVAELTVDTSVPTTLSVELDDGTTRRRITFPDPAEHHVRPLLGLRGNTTLTATVTLTDPRGGEVELPPVTYPVPPVPFALPDLSLRVALPGGGEGVTWLPAKADDLSVLLAVDAEATVVWARRMEAGPWAITPGADASVSMLIGNSGMWVLELGGGWRVAYGGEAPFSVPVGDVEGFSHEATPLPGGGGLLLHDEPLVVDDFPNESLTSTRTVTIDDPVVVEFDPTGAVVHQWSMAERLAPTRIGFGSNDNCERRCDWGHANAAVHDPHDDSILVSLRHQDAVVKLDRATGEVRWILANHDGWPSELAPLLLEPSGAPFYWPTHQHAPMVHPSDPSLLVMFDNGNDNRTTPYANNPLPGLQSRVVAYRVDEVARTVSEEWSYLEGTSPEYLYSHILGNADWLGADGDRVLATFGSLQSEDGVRNEARGLGERSVRVIEVDPALGRSVWDLSVTSTAAARRGGWQVDRAVRGESLYGDSALEEVLAP